MNRYYTARRGHTGNFYVLAPDELTVEAEFPTIESAQAHALALNEWVDARPDPAEVRPFFAPAKPRREPDEFQLYAILDRLLRAEVHACELLIAHARAEYEA